MQSSPRASVLSIPAQDAPSYVRIIGDGNRAVVIRLMAAARSGNPTSDRQVFCAESSRKRRIVVLFAPSVSSPAELKPPKETPRRGRLETGALAA